MGWQMIRAIASLASSLIIVGAMIAFIVWGVGEKQRLQSIIDDYHKINEDAKAISAQYDSLLSLGLAEIPPEPGFVPGKMWMGRWHAHGRSPCWKPFFDYPHGDKWIWDEQRCPPA